MSKNKLSKWLSTIKGKKQKRLYVHNVSITDTLVAGGDNAAELNSQTDLPPPEVKFELERTL